MYLTTRDLTSWSQPYHDDKGTKQLYSVWILPVNYKRIMNRHARRIDPRVDKLASKTLGPSCSDYRVAWYFDSPWITGPMTAHQSVAYLRHIKLAPAANHCTLSAIVFLPIKHEYDAIFADTRSRPNQITGPGPKSGPAGKSESRGPENGVSRWRRPNSAIYSQNHHFRLVYDMIYQFLDMDAKNYKFGMFCH